MKTINLKYILAAILAVFIAVVSVGGTSASAATAYSGVLEDLRADKNFNEDDYPQIEDDYSLKVVQIAESAEGELFVYVYQPSGKLHFTYIVISTDRQNWGNYRLGLINSAGVFHKYRVIGFTVSDAAERYYDIPNILRSFDSSIDDEPAEGQSVSDVGCKVGQFWTATTDKSGKVSYSVIDTEIIEIKEKVVGYCEYQDGTKMGWDIAKGYTKAYFVAFSTDKSIDKLISADVSFYAQDVSFYLCGNQEKHDHDFLYDYHDMVTKDYGTGIYDDASETVELDMNGQKVSMKIEKYPPLTINHTEKLSTPGGGWTGALSPASTYSCNRIRSTSAFIADNNIEEYHLTSGGEEALKDTQWVLNFYETQDKIKVKNAWASYIPGITNISGVGDYEVKTSDVYSVQILRLEFETEGERYNLGVVDNRQTGNEQFNYYKGKKPPWWVWIIVACVVLFFIGILGAIFKPIGKVVFAPFRFVKKKIKERRETKENHVQNTKKEQPK
ncbi:MAG: hypothetical protein NC311_14465 [Muribaculaceae bacterium]|nr:hypothetical protein [Muribaculaceae bacterium]